MDTELEKAVDLEALAAGTYGLLRGLGVPEDGLREAIEETLAVVEGAGVKGEGTKGDLGLGDLYRIRLGKLAARLLPPERFRDLDQRLRLGKGIRSLVEAALGGSLSPSPFLDP